MSYQTHDINFEDIANHLASIDPEILPSELQGAALGLGCMHDDKKAKSMWANYLIEEFDVQLDSEQHQTFFRVIGKMFNSCQKALKEDDMSFQLCLPDDDEPLEERVEAFGAWCKGFLYGLGLIGKPELLKEPSIQEAITDLSQMMNVSIDPDEPHEDEKAFLNLVEYARMVPLMIYNHVRSSLTKEKTLH